MSGSGYHYFYPPTYSTETNTWSNWSVEQQQYNNSIRNNVQQHSSVLSNTVVERAQNFANNRSFQQRRYGNTNQSFNNAQQNQFWQRNNNNNFNKRQRLQSSSNSNEDARNKSTKKRKKPLSQNIPSKRDWTLKDAETALAVEKDYNKRLKNHSLIIKFPDQELNREIVSKFHNCIENVHFQQPSTPRFCFVTLKETADAEDVINSLNKIKFGEGFLTAEYKKDREEDQNLGPEDIDPCTLYVGNLAQEITKEDMVKTYPKQRRIDIGYAKKMKYTRYAFVSFKNIVDSIEAFKKTHSTQMHSKSLIVRFRRLHGTVGMPGETQPQCPTKRLETSISNDLDRSSTDYSQIATPIVETSTSINQLDQSSAEQNSEVVSSKSPIVDQSDVGCLTEVQPKSDKDEIKATVIEPRRNERSLSQTVLDILSSIPQTILTTENVSSSNLDLSVVKQERNLSDDEAPCECKTDFTEQSPIIKKEVIEEEVPISDNIPLNGFNNVVQSQPMTEIKTEEDEDSSEDENMDQMPVDFGNLLNQLDRTGSHRAALNKF